MVFDDLPVVNSPNVPSEIFRLSLVQVGLGKRTPQDFAAELEAKRCEFLNEPAPPQGLYLKEVFYTDFEAKFFKKRA